MKNIIIVVCILFAGRTIACNSCGCSLSGNALGILSLEQRNYIALFYAYQAFKHVPDNALSPNTARYNTWTLTGGYAINNRWQVSAVIPYKFNTLDEPEKGEKQLNGAGDVSLAATWTVFNTADSIMKKWRQLCTLTSSVKLPTGTFEKEFAVSQFPAALSAGTGSYDFSVSSKYALQYKTWTLQSSLTYVLNTANAVHYSFGDQVQASVLAAKNMVTKKLGITPFAGAEYFAIQPDKKYIFEQEGTGGNLVYTKAGGEISAEKFLLGFNVMIPLQASFKSHETITALANMQLYINYKF